MNRFLFAADLHLQPAAWRGRPSLRGDSYYALEQIQRLAKEFNCPVVLGGDIFDTSRPDPESAECFRRFCGEVTANGQSVFHILGNHDASDPGWPDILGSKRLAGVADVGGIRVYGLDYTPRAHLQEALAKVPADSLLICHQAWKELAGGSHYDGSIADCPTNAVLSGDLHITMFLDTPKQVASPGSTCMQSIDESAEKFVLLVSPGEWNLPYKFTQVPIRSRHVYRHNAMTAANLDEVCVWLQHQVRQDDSLPPDLQKPIVVVEYDPEFSRVAERLSLSAGEQCHLFMVSRPRTRQVVDVSTPGFRGMEFMSLFTEVATTAAPGDADKLIGLIRAASSSRQQAEDFLRANMQEQLAAVRGAV